MQNLRNSGPPQERPEEAEAEAEAEEEEQQGPQAKKQKLKEKAEPPKPELGPVQTWMISKGVSLPQPITCFGGWMKEQSSG
ncbi:hypothetical protein SMACR_05006 [Sordaria macrospora]|uniref:WGS project CABT00000000 data, contig 2.8 n=2 Tax=Sordaria macrospora TaxID=5147 RepID=F7VUQ1_SORMK|nr:uncharacterized protein SMAC_05006 [Sordaria macrospora k-hell]KAA8636211.1 hypothetical protein SMACR_05006 [Sordaria macrospora]WPJ57453.1 hypothetical protein SMAC4_05006 [Sordaria macrospora]CCC09247.1 unnamed protein product [Sordaria macrospora k-hell]